MPSRSSAASVDDDYPSLLWITVPPVLLLSAYFIRKWYLARRLRVHGIGKGAPGFQTNVRRIRVTPEIAARLRRGEEVSPEEIAAAAAKMEEEERRRSETSSEAEGESSGSGAASTSTPKSTSKRNDKVKDKEPPTEPVNEWLPDSITAPKKRSKGKRR